MPLSGSCLCGGVRYEIDGLDMPIGHCHCHTCRKAHASAYATTAGVMREHFRWTDGEELRRAFESSLGKVAPFLLALRQPSDGRAPGPAERDRAGGDA